MPKPESSYSLASNASQTSLGVATVVPRVNISEEPLDRREIISITVDVQNFLAAISRLKKSMEEADNDSEDKGMVGCGCWCCTWYGMTPNRHDTWLCVSHFHPTICIHMHVATWHCYVRG